VRQTLVDRAKQGDVEAFDALARTAGGRCMAIAHISWIDEIDAYRYNQGPNQHDVLRILNARGVRVAFSGSFFTSTPIGEREELQSVVDSIEIVPPAPPETTPSSPGQ
jgi:hypothetical protein